MDDDGTQDISILNEVIDKLKNLNFNCPLIIKSTILPNALEQMSLEIPNLVYNPEFLREKHANEDFINPNMIVIGSKNNDVIKFLENFYRKYTNCKCKKYIKTDLTTASLIKFTINSFLATKVSFFNELNSVFSETNSSESCNNFVKFLSYDDRLGNSHMSVPGHDGRLGFGGACLPKNLLAFAKFA